MARHSTVRRRESVSEGIVDATRCMCAKTYYVTILMIKREERVSLHISSPTIFHVCTVTHLPFLLRS